MSRKNAREEVFKLIFEFCMNGEQNEISLNETLKLKKIKDEETYIREVYFGAMEKYGEISEIIKKYAKGFAFERIFKVDLAILILAIYEIKYIEEIPSAVSINEALNLAKMYSTEKSSSFINGILANLVK